MSRRLPLVLALLSTALLLVALWPPAVEHWDEIQIELGMRRWNLAFHEPHPPGYVLFVLSGRWLGKLLPVAHPGRLLTLGAALAWVWLVSARVPERARRLWPLALPILLVVSPTFVVHATTGRTYLVEATLWTSILLLVMSPSPPWLFLGALVGIAGGFRPTVLAFGLVALPYALWRHRSSVTRRGLVGLAAALMAGVAIWVSALAILSGGFARYQALSQPLVRGNILAKSIFFQGFVPVVRERLPAMLLGVWDGLGPILVVTLVLLVLRRRRPELGDLDPLLLGALVPFVFYFVVIYDADGYSLSYLLPLLTWTVLSAARLLEARPLHSALGFAALCTLWALLPTGVGGAEGPLVARARMQTTRRARLAAVDGFPPDTTLVIVGHSKFFGWSFRTVMLERPALTVLQMERDPFVAGLDPQHPYLLAHQLVTSGFGPDFSDLGDAVPGLRTVIFSAPKEIPTRVGTSCGPFARALDTATGERLLRVDVNERVRVLIVRGILQCATR